MLTHEKSPSNIDIPEPDPMVTRFGPWDTHDTNESSKFKCLLSQDINIQQKQSIQMTRKKLKNRKISQRQAIKRKISVASCSATYQSKQQFSSAEKNWNKNKQKSFDIKCKGISLEARRNWFPPLIAKKRVHTQIIHQRYFSGLKDAENVRSKKIIMFRENSFIRSESKRDNNPKLLSVDSKKQKLRLVPIQVKFFQNS